MADIPAGEHAHETHGHGSMLGHVVPVRVLIAVWAVLVIMTGLTYTATWVDLGGLNLWVALGIATLKAALVALYFMHLRYDRPINAIVFVFALFFVALFLGGTLIDADHYQPDVVKGYAPAMNVNVFQAP